jgi:hypothetical protein
MLKSITYRLSRKKYHAPNLYIIGNVLPVENILPLLFLCHKLNNSRKAQTSLHCAHNGSHMPYAR